MKNVKKKTIRVTAARGCVGGSTARALAAAADRSGRTWVPGRSASGDVPVATRLAPPVRFMIRRARLLDVRAVPDWPSGEAIRLAMERDSGTPCRVTVYG